MPPSELDGPLAHDEELTRLLTEQLPALRAFIRLRGGPSYRARESTADLVQSTVRELLENLGRFQHPDADGFKRWLFATANRKIKNRHLFHRAARRDGRREVTPFGGTDSDPDPSVYSGLGSPADAAMAREDVERLERAFDLLKAADREILLLAHFQAMPAAAVAEELGIDPGAVRTRLSRARARLARAFVHASA